MGLFNKNNKAMPVNLPDQKEEALAYQDVVDYLTNLSQQDYNKLQKVVNIYRNADKDVKKVLNIKDAPLETDEFTKDELDDLFLIDTNPEPRADKNGNKSSRQPLSKRQEASLRRQAKKS